MLARSLLVAIALGGSLLLLPAASSQEPSATGEGCTPCECNAAICHGGTFYWIEFQNVSYERLDGIVLLRWSLTVNVTGAPPDPNVTLPLTKLGYGRYSDAHGKLGRLSPEGYEQFLTFGNSTYPSNQSVGIPWPTNEGLYARLFGFRMSDELFVPAQVEPSQGPVFEPSPTPVSPANAVAFAGVLAAAVASAFWRPRRPK